MFPDKGSRGEDCCVYRRGSRRGGSSRSLTKQTFEILNEEPHGLIFRVFRRGISWRGLLRFPTNSPQRGLLCLSTRELTEKTSMIPDEEPLEEDRRDPRRGISRRGMLSFPTRFPQRRIVVFPDEDRGSHEVDVRDPRRGIARRGLP